MGVFDPLEQCVRGSRRDVRRWECVERSKSASVTVSLRGAICSASLCRTHLLPAFSRDIERVGSHCNGICSPVWQFECEGSAAAVKKYSARSRDRDPSRLSVRLSPLQSAIYALLKILTTVEIRVYQ